MGSYVSGVQHQLAWQLPLNPKRPLNHSGDSPIWLIKTQSRTEAGKETQRRADGWRKSVGKRRANLKKVGRDQIPVHGTNIAGCLAEPRRRAGFDTSGIADTKTSPQYGL